MHKDIVHGDGKQESFECSECEKTFSNISNLNRHLKTVHEDLSRYNVSYLDNIDDALKFECQQCEKKFHRKDVLKRHVQTVHSEKNEYSCSNCEKKFARKDKLKSHMKLMHCIK